MPCCCAQVVLVYKPRQQIDRDYWKLWRLLEIIWYYWRLLEFTWYYWRLLEITWYYWRLLEITWYFSARAIPSFSFSRPLSSERAFPHVSFRPEISVLPDSRYQEPSPSCWWTVGSPPSSWNPAEEPGVRWKDKKVVYVVDTPRQ